VVSRAMGEGASLKDRRQEPDHTRYNVGVAFVQVNLPDFLAMLVPQSQGIMCPAPQCSRNGGEVRISYHIRCLYQAQYGLQY
jgi:hypothetical protein